MSRVIHVPLGPAAEARQKITLRLLVEIGIIMVAPMTAMKQASSGTSGSRDDFSFQNRNCKVPSRQTCKLMRLAAIVDRDTTVQIVISESPGSN